MPLMWSSQRQLRTWPLLLLRLRLPTLMMRHAPERSPPASRHQPLRCLRYTLASCLRWLYLYVPIRHLADGSLALTS